MSQKEVKKEKRSLPTTKALPKKLRNFLEKKKTDKMCFGGPSFSHVPFILNNAFGYASVSLSLSLSLSVPLHVVQTRTNTHTHTHTDAHVINVEQHVSHTAHTHMSSHSRHPPGGASCLTN